MDPENHQFLEETNLPTPMTTRVYVNLLEGIHWENHQSITINGGLTGRYRKKVMSEKPLQELVPPH
jgi:hypothetical protein